MKKCHLTLIYLSYLIAIFMAGLGLLHLFRSNTPSPTAFLINPDADATNDTVFRKNTDANVSAPVVLNPNINKTYDNVEFKINSDGFRDIEFSKEKSRSRMLFLGDSFTFGHGLPLEETFVKILEKKVNNSHQGRWETLNLGISGYNTKWEVDLLESRGLKYRPDIVFLMYYLNDPDDRVNLSFGKNGYEVIAKIGDYLSGNIENETERQQVKEFLDTQNCTEALMQMKAEKGFYEYHTMLHILPIFWSPVEVSFDRLKAMSEDHNFTVVLAIIPNMDFSIENYLFKDVHKQVSEAGAKRGFFVLDLYPGLSKYPRDKLRLSTTDGHTSYYANGLIAAALEDFLEEHRLLEVT